MADIEAEDPIEVAAGDTYVIANGDPIALDFTEVLETPDATISAVDSVTVTPGSGLNLNNAAANTSTYTGKKRVNGELTDVTVAIGKAVWIDKVAGSTPNLYTVEVIVSTSAGSKRDGRFLFDVG